MRTLVVRLAMAMFLMVATQRCERPLGYQVRIANTGTSEIHDVRVTYGRFVDQLLQLAPGIDSTYLDVQEPLPSEAAVEWRDSSGNPHREVVKVMPQSEFRGVLIFEIDRENRVRVRTEAPPRH